MMGTKCCECLVEGYLSLSIVCIHFVCGGKHLPAMLSSIGLDWIGFDASVSAEEIDHVCQSDHLIHCQSRKCFPNDVGRSGDILEKVIPSRFPIFCAY
jgi:hypothetical protein